MSRLKLLLILATVAIPISCVAVSVSGVAISISGVTISVSRITIAIPRIAVAISRVTITVPHLGAGLGRGLVCGGLPRFGAVLPRGIGGTRHRGGHQK